MTDPRIKTLANNLLTYSVRLQPGENVLIESTGENDALVLALVKKAYELGGSPYVKLALPRISREILRKCNEGQLKLMAEVDLLQMRNMQAYIGVRGGNNAAENSDVPRDCLDRYNRLYSHPVTDYRVRKTKWVVLRYPTPSFAQQAGMSTEAFEDFYFNVCNLDYARMDAAMDPLKALMERTDCVRIKGPGTDLSFSIKGISAIKCAGEMNIPDGEIYTAPVRDSVNGTLAFPTAQLHQGFTYENIALTFKGGKIIDSASNDKARMDAVLNTDEGARCVGEFALGVHPHITRPMRDTLFDEKISGSFHFTPGRCYDEADNGNQSAIHWDLVCIQTPEYGGGEIYFDDVLIRKDGRFVLEELLALNPENL